MGLSENAYGPGPVWQGRRGRPPGYTRNGRASTLDERQQVVQLKHVVGFRRDDWGEGNWTARDLR